jgi:hypothetical protein
MAQLAGLQGHLQNGVEVEFVGRFGSGFYDVPLPCRMRIFLIGLPLAKSASSQGFRPPKIPLTDLARSYY